MRWSIKAWLIAAASLVLLGGCVFAAAMTVLKWDFTKLETSQYVTNEYAIAEEPGAIVINADTADITFVLCEGAARRVVCDAPQSITHAVAVKEGTLFVEAVDERKWYEYIGINFASPRITLYLSQGEYDTLFIKSDTGDVEIPADFKFNSIDVSTDTGDVTCLALALETVKIATSTGDISIENTAAGCFDLSTSTGDVTASLVSCAGDITIGVSTGKVQLTSVVCKSLITSGSTGDISLHHVVAAERLSIERSTGDVSFYGADAAEIIVVTDTGDVEGSLLSEKIFITKTDTGSVHHPHSEGGGRCEITTDTGDITLSVLGD